MQVDAGIALAFLLVLARTSAWVMTIPLLAGVPGMARLTVALSLAVFVAPMVHPTVPADALSLLAALLGQVVIGLAMGWLTGLLFHAFQVAGSLVDASSGFAIGAMLDPVSGVQSSVYGRLTNLVVVTILVVTNAHVTLFAGFVRTFSALPPDHFPVLDGGGAVVLGQAAAGLMVAAVEIAAPVLGALFLTEVALAVAARFAPQANVFAIGLPVKMMVSLLAMGTTLVLLPAHLPGILDGGLRVAGRVLR